MFGGQDTIRALVPDWQDLTDMIEPKLNWTIYAASPSCNIGVHNLWVLYLGEFNA